MEINKTINSSDNVDLMINMGPQHPSTHGVFRLLLNIDGERIINVQPHIGYLHRGSEKLCENERYAQVITLFDRLDYVANLNMEFGFCLAVEKLMELDIPVSSSAVMYPKEYSLKAIPDKYKDVWVKMT